MCFVIGWSEERCDCLGEALLPDSVSLFTRTNIQSSQREDRITSHGISRDWPRRDLVWSRDLGWCRDQTACWEMMGAELDLQGGRGGGAGDKKTGHGPKK